jgi:site-specific DNA-methyltransferase (adenine-specific)
VTDPASAQRDKRQPVHVCHSSAADEWETPPHLFAELDREFGFTLDAAASATNALCARYYTKADDALSQPWDGVVWVNPPYGKGVTGRWVRKAWEEAQRGATVVCLIPARTDTAYWHDHVLRGEIRYIRQRLRFSGTRQPAPFPSVVVIFRPGDGHRNGRSYAGYPASVSRTERK